MEWLILAAALILCAILTGIVRRVALSQQILDIPNERSSHTRPTPRSGGIGFVVTFLGGLVVLYLGGIIPGNLFAALVIGGSIVAIVGYIDDVRHLSPYVRLVLQFVAALIGTVLINGLPQLTLGFAVVDLGLIGHIVAVVGTIWLINLYNFMDGIDGIAASEAVIACLVVGVLLAGTTGGLVWVCGLLAASCLGFLYWNWSPARIFMGDVGSGFLGYTLAILAIASGQQAPALLWVWLILLGVFITDTLITLVNRVRRGEKWHQAHRTHAYQHATIRWNSHARVTTAVILINLLWLTPCALLLWAQPSLVIPVTLVAYVPLVVLALYFKAGIKLGEAKKVDEIGVSNQTISS